ncbi:MAG TPA: type II secretion system F family protein [Patescibacteria group bacterium]|nr:type II secretion system F family protein [Patescibacteria group bacterium]
MKNLKDIKISGNDKVSLISNLSTMLAAGIPIVESVDSLLEDSKGDMKILLETLRADLMQGKRIYITFSRFPNIFDSVTTNIIRASEEAGTLDVALSDLAKNLKKDMEFTDSIRSVLIYPAFIGVVFVAVMLVILIEVIPKISTVFTSLGEALPLPTQVLIAVSNFLIHNTTWAILTTGIIIAFFYFLFKTQKKVFMSLFLSLPYISGLGKQIDIARFTRSLYLLLNAGLPIGTAIQLSEAVVNKKEVSLAIKHCEQMVVAGRNLSQGFKDYKTVFPSMIIKITEAGEKSGSLDKSMQDASEYLDYQVAKALKGATTLIEPVMLVVVGILIGGMMLAIIAPMYSLISNVSNTPSASSTP